MIILLKTREGDHHAYDDMAKAGAFMQEYPNDIAGIKTYSSPVEFIKDEYMHNELCMSELLRSVSSEIKLDLEDIIVSLAWAGDDVDPTSISIAQEYKGD